MPRRHRNRAYHDHAVQNQGDYSCQQFSSWSARAAAPRRRRPRRQP
ncbi:hypothetical protein ACFPRL_25010 [Pseudoclavibacter helvolus]